MSKGMLRVGADPPAHSQVRGTGTALRLPVKALLSPETMALECLWGGDCHWLRRGERCCPFRVVILKLGTFVNIWRHFRLSQVGRGVMCSWHLVGRGKNAAKGASYTTQDSPHNKEQSGPKCQQC